eukprot:scaffold13921_cov102-Skeletonema_dohrnii-CCMP3373.AAC.2
MKVDSNPNAYRVAVCVLCNRLIIGCEAIHKITEESLRSQKTGKVQNPTRTTIKSRLRRARFTVPNQRPRSRRPSAITKSQENHEQGRKCSI